MIIIKYYYGARFCPDNIDSRSPVINNITIITNNGAAAEGHIIGRWREIERAYRKPCKSWRQSVFKTHAHTHSFVLYCIICSRVRMWRGSGGGREADDKRSLSGGGGQGVNPEGMALRVFFLFSLALFIAAFFFFVQKLPSPVGRAVHGEGPVVHNIL